MTPPRTAGEAARAAYEKAALACVVAGIRGPDLSAHAWEAAARAAIAFVAAGPAMVGGVELRGSDT